MPLSHFSFSLAFKAVIHIHACIVSHHFLFSRWRLKSFLLTHIIQSHSPWHSYPLTLHIWPSGSYIHPHCPHLITLCLSLIHHCSSRFLLSLHMSWSFEVMPLILVMLLGTLHLVLSCRSIGAVFLGHALYCTPEWFYHYSSLIRSFKSLLETS